MWKQQIRKLFMISRPTVTFCPGGSPTVATLLPPWRLGRSSYTLSLRSPVGEVTRNLAMLGASSLQFCDPLTYLRSGHSAGATAPGSPETAALSKYQPGSLLPNFSDLMGTVVSTWPTLAY